MTIAANLREAAGLAYENLYIPWQTNLLKAKLNNFNFQLNGTFLDAVPTDRPVGNWFIPSTALARAMPSANVSLSDLNAAAQLIYRICWATDAARNTSPPLITLAQYNAVLTAYNGVWG